MSINEPSFSAIPRRSVGYSIHLWDLVPCSHGKNEHDVELDPATQRTVCRRCRRTPTDLQDLQRQAVEERDQRERVSKRRLQVSTLLGALRRCEKAKIPFVLTPDEAQTAMEMCLDELK